MPGMAEGRIAAKRSQERLLERVLGVGSTQKPDQVAEDLVPMLLVEALERR